MDYHGYVNQIKFFFLVMKIGADVFVKTLMILYKGPQPMEDHLVELTLKKSNGLNKDQKIMLEKIKKREAMLEHLDITLTYKLIQLTCGLEPNSDSLGNRCVWSNRCPEEKQKSLEHLLFKYKTERNHIVHKFTGMKSISDQVYDNMKRQNIERLQEIIDRVGEKGMLPIDETESWKNQITEETEMFCQHLTFGAMSSLHSSESRHRSSRQPDLNINYDQERSAIEPTDFKSDRDESTDDEYSIVRPISRSRSGGLPDISCSHKESNERKTITQDYDSIKKLQNLQNKECAYKIQNIICNIFGADMSCKAQWTEKSNRMYWVNKIASVVTLQNPKKMEAFLKKNEKRIAKE